MAWVLEGSIRGPQGPEGPVGPPGEKWFVGSEWPAAAVAGDLFLDTDTGTVYEKMATGSWLTVGNLTGPTGATGPAGPGVPTGGSTGQMLVKTSATDYATGWQTPVHGQTLSTNALSATSGQNLYPQGLSMMYVSLASGWPHQTGVLTTVRHLVGGAYSAIQWFQEENSYAHQRVWMRTATAGGSWRNWDLVAADGAWSNITTFGNGWVSFNNTANTLPQYRMMAGKIVELRGLVSSGSLTADTPICNIPVPYRPAVQHHLPCAHAGGGGVLGVTSTGNVVVKNLSSNAWVSLDGLRYQAA